MNFWLFVIGFFGSGLWSGWFGFVYCAPSLVSAGTNTTDQLIAEKKTIARRCASKAEQQNDCMKCATSVPLLPDSGGFEWGSYKKYRVGWVIFEEPSSTLYTFCFSLCMCIELIPYFMLLMRWWPFSCNNFFVIPEFFSGYAFCWLFFKKIVKNAGIEKI